MSRATRVLLWILAVWLLPLLFSLGVERYVKYRAQKETAQFKQVHAEVIAFLPCGGRNSDCRRAQVRYANLDQTYIAKLRASSSEGLRLKQRLVVWTRPGWVWVYRSPQEYVDSEVGGGGLVAWLFGALPLTLIVWQKGFFRNKPKKPTAQAEEAPQNK